MHASDSRSASPKFTGASEPTNARARTPRNRRGQGTASSSPTQYRSGQRNKDRTRKSFPTATDMNGTEAKQATHRSLARAAETFLPAGQVTVQNYPLHRRVQGRLDKTSSDIRPSDTNTHTPTQRQAKRMAQNAEGNSHSGNVREPPATYTVSGNCSKRKPVNCGKKLVMNPNDRQNRVSNIALEILNKT